MAIEEGICEFCGKRYIKKSKNQKHCCPDCLKEARRRVVSQNQEEYKWKAALAKKKKKEEAAAKKKKVMALSEIMRAATKEGLQYGEYCLKHHLY